MNTSDKSIIIIGAGFAGLAAGIYARLNGYRTQIFEMHSQPGGLCTSWKRKGLHLRRLYPLVGRIIPSKRYARHVGRDRYFKEQEVYRYG